MHGNLTCRQVLITILPPDFSLPCPDADAVLHLLSPPTYQHIAADAVI